MILADSRKTTSCTLLVRAVWVELVSGLRRVRKETPAYQLGNLQRSLISSSAWGFDASMMLVVKSHATSQQVCVASDHLHNIFPELFPVHRPFYIISFSVVASFFTRRTSSRRQKKRVTRRNVPASVSSETPIKLLPAGQHDASGRL